jgi:streptogramin lyase
MRIRGALVACLAGVATMPAPAAASFREYSAPLDGLAELAPGRSGAVWFSELRDHVGLIDRSGGIHEFPTPTATGIASGPDGNAWFTYDTNGGACGVAADPAFGCLGRVTPSGTLSAFRGVLEPDGIALGGDGALWVAEGARESIARVTLDGHVRRFRVSSGAWPGRVVSVSKRELWFTGILRGQERKVWAITTRGSPRSVGSFRRDPRSLVGGPGGRLWAVDDAGRLERLSRTGRLKVFARPRNLEALTRGADDALWLTQDSANRGESFVLRMTRSGRMRRWRIPASRLTAIAEGRKRTFWLEVGRRPDILGPGQSHLARFRVPR